MTFTFFLCNLVLPKKLIVEKENTFQKRSSAALNTSNASSLEFNSPLQKKETQDSEKAASLPAPSYQLDAPINNPPPIQTKPNEAGEASSTKKAASENAASENVLSTMGENFGQDFSSVKINTNSDKAKSMNALAYTQGEKIDFAPGQYNPSSKAGQALIGHELTHVIQQRQNRVKSTNTIQGYQLNDDPALEAEANQMGKKVAEGQKVENLSSSNQSNSSSNPVQRHPGHGHEPAPAPSAPSGATATSTTSTSTTNEAPSTASSFFGGIGDALSSAADSIERGIFDMQDVWGPQSLVPPTFAGNAGYGGFEATYTKSSNSLHVIVRGKTQLISGLTNIGGVVQSNQDDLDSLANILNIIGDANLNNQVIPAYTWTEANKAPALEQFKARLGESIGIWENAGMQFFINKPGWEDITANLNVDLQVSEEGTLGDAAAREASGEHQQIKIYKTASPTERGPMRTAVNQAISKYETDNAMSIGTVSGYDVRAYVDGQDDGAGYADTNAHNGEMNLSSNDLGNSQSNEDFSHLSNKVYFENNSSTLTPQQQTRITNFIQGFSSDADGNSANNSIKLIGHSSSRGSAGLNSVLAQNRINAVKAVIQAAGITNFATRITEDNQGETGAPDDATQDAEYRSVEIKVGSGERQNTVAHEFGHVFGLADEYEEGSRTGGVDSGHSNLSRRMGTGNALVENNDGIISTGNEVRPQHYSTFIWALRELTGKPWAVRNQA